MPISPFPNQDGAASAGRAWGGMETFNPWASRASLQALHYYAASV